MHQILLVVKMACPSCIRCVPVRLTPYAASSVPNMFWLDASKSHRGAGYWTNSDRKTPPATVHLATLSEINREGDVRSTTVTDADSPSNSRARVVEPNTPIGRRRRVVKCRSEILYNLTARLPHVKMQIFSASWRPRMLDLHSRRTENTRGVSMARFQHRTLGN